MFIRKWLTASVKAGKNVRGTQGSMKSGLSCYINARNPERKQSMLRLWSVQAATIRYKVV